MYCLILIFLLILLLFIFVDQLIKLYFKKILYKMKNTLENFCE